MDIVRLCGMGEAVERNMVTRITVLMAVYNPLLGLLDVAVDSILRQSFRDFEFLVIDDGSGEDTRDHLRRRAQDDTRIRVQQEPHRGLTASLNRGIELACGEFIARQDADDWSSPGRLDAQLRHFAAYPDDALCGSNAWTHRQDGKPLWPTRLPESRAKLLSAFPRGNPFVHGSAMFRREAAIAIGGYREAFRCSQDYDFFWRLTERHGAANLREPLYHYRYSSASISAQRATEQLAAHAAIHRLTEARQRGEPEYPERELARAAKELQAGISRALLKQADHSMLAGDYRLAARSYLRFIAAHPAKPIAWAKLVRLGLFRALPFLREACFQ